MIQSSRTTRLAQTVARIQRTSTAISILELMPPRYDGLNRLLFEQESRD